MGNYISLFNTDINNSKYGWKPDQVDHRDHLYQLNYKIDYSKNLPDTIDLRNQCPPIFDQGKLGSCSAQAIAAAYLFDEMKQKNIDQFVPSRLFIYYNERVIEGSVDDDAGAQLRDGMKTINKNGVCHEKLWPYDINVFTQKPTAECYQDAQNHHGISYHRVSQNAYEIKHCLSEGYPIVFGFLVFESFENPDVARTGVMSMPQENDKPIGGHAVLAVGYDDKKQCFIVRNSWSSNWGDHGYFYMPYQYMLNPKLAADFWTLRKVTED